MSIIGHSKLCINFNNLQQMRDMNSHSIRGKALHIYKCGLTLMQTGRNTSTLSLQLPLIGSLLFWMESSRLMTIINRLVLLGMIIAASLTISEIIAHCGIHQDISYTLIGPDPFVLKRYLPVRMFGKALVYFCPGHHLLTLFTKILNRLKILSLDLEC